MLQIDVRGLAATFGDNASVNCQKLSVPEVELKINYSRAELRARQSVSHVEI